MMPTKVLFAPVFNYNYKYADYFYHYSRFYLKFPMLRKIVIIIAVYVIPHFCYAQKHDYNWLAGYGNSSADPLLGGFNIDFNTQPTAIYTDKKKIDFSFYTGVCSDSSGNLAFYTNGISIRDVTHNKMLNGDTINPGSLWLDWQHDYFPSGPFCFALPAPGRHNQYVFFHMSGFFVNGNHGTSPFYYSVIDMDGNNGLGQVTEKNQVLLETFKNYIDPVAVKHGNGRDWWIITGEVQKPVLYTFLLDPDGVHGPFTTMMPFQFSGTDYQSINDISPDGNTYVRAAGRLGLYIYDFDRCSGTLNNLKALPFANQDFFCFATVFAPDSKHLFLSSWEAVTQIDISAPDIALSLDTLAYFDGKASPSPPFVTGFFNPNLGPDGKIYYATTNGTLSLHVIHNPDLPGIAADVEQHGISLPKFNSGTMAQFPNYRLGELEGSPCDTLNGQRPGDGFVKSDWYPPVYNNPDSYTLLPPLFPNEKNARKADEHIPDMMELAMKRRSEEREQAKTKDSIKND